MRELDNTALLSNIDSSEPVSNHPYRDFELAGWERAASAYADTFEAATRLFARPLLDAVCARAGTQLLDVACGTGEATALAAAQGAIAVGTDFSAAMLAQARRIHPALRFEQADAEALPFADAAFDAVVINFGVHHFPFPLRALSEARRVLRPTGRLAFTVWASPEEHALHKITLDALRDAGVSGAALPTPPAGAVNRIDTCVQLLHDAGFAEPAPIAIKIEAPLWLDSAQQLINLLCKGTVRLSSLIESQAPETAGAVTDAIRRASAAYLVGGRLRIPVTAILASAANA